jgi:hypothetical protein
MTDGAQGERREAMGNERSEQDLIALCLLPIPGLWMMAHWVRA